MWELHTCKNRPSGVVYDMRMRERAAVNVNTTFFYDVTPCGLADTKVSPKP